MKTETPKTDAILSRIPGGQTCDPQLVADELRGPIAEMEREIHAWQTELSKVMPPDFKSWWQNSKAEWPLVARLVIEGKNRRAGQLERELGSPTDEPDANTTAHARVNWWKDRCDDLNEQLAAKDAHADEIYKAAVDLANMLSDKLDAEKEEHAETRKDYLCIAELLDGHDATECRANLEKLKADLASERALADRLADAAINQRGEDGALAAWKDARKTETKYD